MINKSNDLPSFVNETNLPNIVNKLTDAKNIKISNNKYGNRVQTVVDKIVEKADDITKAIEQEVVNNSYSFKVGTGDVDVSTDVEDGFGEVGIKGVTYQNLWNINKVNGATIEGNTVKVLASANDYKFCGIYLKDSCLKPNTTYTLITNVFENTLDGRFNPCIGHSASVFKTNAKEFQAKTTGVSISVLTTTSAFTTENIGVRTYVLNDCTEGFIKYNMLILEGDHTNNPNLPSYFEDIVGVGDKSKNLFNGKTRNGYYSNGVFTANSSNLANAEPIKIKPNTYYSGSGDALPRMTFYDKDMNFISYHTTTPILSPSNACYLNIHAMGATYFQIEEGSVATSYEPYYDGHKIEILSNGKNLFKPDIVTDTKSYTLHTSNGYWGTVFKVKPNTDYKITSKSDGFNLTTIAQSYVYFIGNGGGECWIVHQTSNPSGDSEGIVNSGSKGEIYIRMPSYTFPIIPYMLIHRKIQIEEGTTGTTYTPYIEDKTQILLDEPLMRLPNGICDEITRDGKLIKRVGKIVLNGSENSWNYWTQFESDTHISFHNNVSVSFGLPNYPEIAFGSTVASGTLCDNLVWEDTVLNINGTKVGFVIRNASPNYVAIRLQKSTLGITSNMIRNEIIDKLSQWLKSNPIVLYYQLPNPTITELPAPYLRIFKDGHLTFNTLVAPESNHVVQLNKSGQIQNAIKESQSLDNRINVLENNYDNLMLSTISRLNDLEFNYTLK